MPERHHPDCSPEGIGNEIGHAVISSRKKCLQDLDGQTDRKPKRDCGRCGTLGLSHQREIGEEEESEWNEPGNVDADILPVVPVLVKLIPGSFKKLFAQDKETFWDKQVSR